MPQKSFGFVASALTATVAAVLVGCGSNNVSTPKASESIVASPDPMAASNLDASIVIGSAYQGPSIVMGMVIVSITFSQLGKEVILAATDSVECNGVELKREYSRSVLTQTYWSPEGFKRIGTVFEFIYRHHGSSTSIRISSLAAPKITSPKSGTTLSRRAGFTMSYEPVLGGQVSASIELSTPDAQYYLGLPEQLDTGTYAINPTMMTFLGRTPGWAWLKVLQRVETKPGETGFMSVAINNSADEGAVQVWLR